MWILTLDLKDNILQNVRIDQYIGQYTKLKKQSGGKCVGLCPFHQEKSPSFTVDLQKGLYYCFGCSKGGDLFRFVMDTDRLDFPEACKKLAEYAGIELQGPKPLSAGDWQAMRQKLVLQAFTQECMHSLWGSSDSDTAASSATMMKSMIGIRMKPAQRYLAKRELKAETCHAFRLGFFPHDWNQNNAWMQRALKRAQKLIRSFEQEQIRRHPTSATRVKLFDGLAFKQQLEQSGILMPSSYASGPAAGGSAAENGAAANAKDKLKDESELVLPKENWWSPYAGRIIFPLINNDTRQAVCSLGGRLLGNQAGKPKYINGRETSIFHKKSFLYGLAQNGTAMQRSRTAILVEGYLDVISLWQSGVSYACAPLGSAVSVEHVQILAKKADHLFLMFDGDSAGRASMLRLISLIWNQPLSLDVRVIPLPANTDPGDLASSLAALFKQTQNSNENENVASSNHTNHTNNATSTCNNAANAEISKEKLMRYGVPSEHFFILEHLQPEYERNFSGEQSENTATADDDPSATANAAQKKNKALSHFFSATQKYYSGQSVEDYPQGLEKLPSLRRLFTALLDIPDETRRVVLLEETAKFLQLSIAAIEKQWTDYLEANPSHKKRFAQTITGNTRKTRKNQSTLAPSPEEKSTPRVVFKEALKKGQPPQVNVNIRKQQQLQAKEQDKTYALEREILLCLLHFPQYWEDFYEKILELELEDFNSNILFRVLEDNCQAKGMAAWTPGQMNNFSLDDETMALFVAMTQQKQDILTAYAKEDRAHQVLAELCSKWEISKLKKNTLEVVKQWTVADNESDGGAIVLQHTKRINEMQKMMRTGERESIK